MDNEDYNKEYKEENNIIKKYPIELYILNEEINSVCKIITSKDNNKETGTGFFLDLSDIIGRKCLLTNYHVIEKESVKKQYPIIIKFENKREIPIKLNKENRYIKYFERPKDITIIEILDSDNITDISFFNYNKGYTEGYNQYVNKDIVILQFPKDLNLSTSQGKITKLRKNFEFMHNCATDKGSSGSPILLYDRTLIGIHKGKDQNDNNVATFIGSIINSLKKEKYEEINSKFSINNNSSIDNISLKLKKFIDEYNEFERNIENKNKLEVLLKNIENLKLLFILMLGEDNLANINILNGLIERQILPKGCKNKNIIIKHSQKSDIILRKAKIKNENYTNLLDLNGEIIARGFEEVQTKLDESNENIKKDNEEFLYKIEINIEFINNLDTKDLKEKICFINLPDLFNKKDIYKQIIENCNIFLYVINSSKSNKNYNLKRLEDLKELLPKYKDTSDTKFIKQYIKKCLFIINQDKDQKISREVFDNIMNYYLTYEEQNNMNLNIQSLNTGFYERYMNKYYNSLEETIQNEYMRFIYSNNSKKNKNEFDEYIFEEFERNYKNDIPSNKNNNNQSEPSIEEVIKENDLIKNYEINSENFKYIKMYFSLAKEYLYKEKTVIEKNNESFIKNLLYLIQNTNIELNSRFKTFTYNFFINFDPIIDKKNFKKPDALGQNNQSQKLDKLKSKSEIVKYNLNNKIQNISITMYSKIKVITNIITNLYNNRENYVNNPLKKEEEIKENINQFFKEQLNDLLYFLDSQINELSEYSNLQYHEFCKLLNELEQKYERKLSSYMDFINKPNPFYNKIVQLRKFSVEDQSKIAISFENIGGFLSFFFYFFPEKTKITKLSKIIEYLAKETEKIINDVPQEIQNINNNYATHFKYEIDRLFNDSKYFEEEKNKEKFNKEMEEYQSKKSQWKKIKNEYQDIKNEINSI